MRMWGVAGVAVIALAGCQTQVPDSNPGVGFGDYASYEIERAQREARGGVAPALPPVGAVAAGPIGAPVAAPISAPMSAPGTISANDLAAAGIGAAGAGGQPLPLPGPGAIPVDASPGNAPPPLIASSGISDEQDFDAVASRETIESDAQRRAAQAAAYTVIQPTALPEPPSDTGPNIVEYALSAPNRVGQPWYSRFILSGQARFERNCAAYRTPDEAQRDFLDRGGPERDPRGIDPDGDGFACGWDPAPFLAAVGRN